MEWTELPGNAGWSAETPDGGNILLLAESFDGEMWTVRCTKRFEEHGVQACTVTDLEWPDDEYEKLGADGILRDLKNAALEIYERTLDHVQEVLANGGPDHIEYELPDTKDLN